jgi:hypothetical protein
VLVDVDRPGWLQGFERSAFQRNRSTLQVETELSHGWRQPAWQTQGLFHKIKCAHRDGQRLDAPETMISHPVLGPELHRS